MLIQDAWVTHSFGRSSIMALRGGLRDRRRELRMRVRQVLGAVLLVITSVAGLAAWMQQRSSAFYGATSGLESERLLANQAHSSSHSGSGEELDGDCVNLQSWELNGGVFLYIAVLVYNFIALAIIADDYFVSSLEKITDAMELSQDVAGATFMAAGSSAPELFVSLADNVFDEPKESMGIGTIVGSAIFNILIIIGLSAALAGQPLALDWRPMLRDSIWYTWSILLLSYSIWDGVVDTTESVLLFCSYFCYIAYMSQNERVVGRCCKRPEEQGKDELETAKHQASSTKMKENTPLVVTDATGSSKKLDISSLAVDVEQLHLSDGKDKSVPHRRTSPSWIQRAQTSNLDHHVDHHDGVEDESVTEDGVPTHLNPVHLSKYRVFQSHPHLHQQSSPSTEDGSSANAELPHEHQTIVDANIKTSTSISTSSEVALVPDEKTSEEPDTGYFDEIMDVPSGVLAKLWYGFTLPIVVVARLTIPDCRFPRFSGVAGFTSSFIVCIIWIGILSHYTVAWGTKVGCIAGIPSALMGLTIIAAGASIPDALSSILVARDGHGDMAVSNALGSNVFDILLGLGLPFFLSNLVYKKPVAISTDDLDVSVAILFAVLIFLVFLLVVTRWRLHPRMGAALLLMYCVYVAFTYVHGLGKI